MHSDSENSNGKIFSVFYLPSSPFIYLYLYVTSTELCCSFHLYRRMYYLPVPGYVFSILDGELPGISCPFELPHNCVLEGMTRVDRWMFAYIPVTFNP